jgi:hypothetical protein
MCTDTSQPFWLKGSDYKKQQGLNLFPTRPHLKHIQYNFIFPKVPEIFSEIFPETYQNILYVPSLARPENEGTRVRNLNLHNRKKDPSPLPKVYLSEIF